MPLYLYEILNRERVCQVFIREKVAKFSEYPVEYLEAHNLDFWDFYGSGFVLTTKKMSYPEILKEMGGIFKDDFNFVKRLINERK